MAARGAAVAYWHNEKNIEIALDSYSPMECLVSHLINEINLFEILLYA